MDKSHTTRLTAPDGTGIDITIKTDDQRLADKWIAAVKEAHDLRERAPFRPKWERLEQAVSRAFPVLGSLMIGLTAVAVLVALTQCIGIIEPFDAAVLIGRLLVLAVTLVCLVLALIGVEARLHRFSGSIRHATKRVKA
jgi:hypothetical protein